MRSPGRFLFFVLVMAQHGTKLGILTGGNKLEAYTVEGHTYAPLGVVNGLHINVATSKAC